MKVLIIGYGNDSRRDDGVGPYVIRQLESYAAPQLELIALHQLEIELAETISQVDAVIFVDAAIAEAPHPVARVAVKAERESHAVAHYVTPGDLLALTQLLYQRAPAAFLYSIRGHDFDFGMSLSTATKEAADEVVWEIRQLVELLKRPGAAPQDVLAAPVAAGPVR